MAHFAKIDGNQKVTEVIVIDNKELQGLDFPSSEPIGQQYIANIGLAGNWLQTSYNGKFRKKYAGIGYTFDKKLDAFLAPKPFDSWVLGSSFDWEPPTPYPSSLNKIHTWNESKKSWDEVGDLVRPAVAETQPLPDVGQLPMGPNYEVK